jgi:DNA polymerase III epsilon subunit-like protein
MDVAAGAAPASVSDLVVSSQEEGRDPITGRDLPAANDNAGGGARAPRATLEDLMGRFGIVSKNRHDGLEDCRVEAEILRRVMGDLA